MTPKHALSPAGYLYRLLGFARRPELLAFLPALTLAAFWVGGEGYLLVTALTVPMIYALAGIVTSRQGATRGAAARHDSETGTIARDTMIGQIDTLLQTAEATGRRTACLVVQVDDAEAQMRHHGQVRWAGIMERSAERLSGALRQNDVLVQPDTQGFVIVLAPTRRADLENVLQIAARLQTAAAEPLSMDTGTAHVTVSVGFCLSSRAPAPTGAALLEAAEKAARAARRNGGEGLRNFARDIDTTAPATGSGELEAALEDGRVQAFFQPQISTDTGEVTGFESLVRLEDPSRGTVMPAEFLPALQAAGLTERLGEIMLQQALTALRGWDRAGLDVPRVAVNFAPEELRNPQLARKIEWELDRFGVAPGRLVVEILESVVAGFDDEVIVHNVAQLARMGCTVDLDDFGSGQAAIAGIRRFSVRRIKIDRCFVTRVHKDRDQQRLVSAILSMAEQLQLETLAEGVEDAGEHSMLAQLGCGHVQGFGIARPMPFRDSIDWIGDHRQRLLRAPRLQNRIG